MQSKSGADGYITVHDARWHGYEEGDCMDTADT
jgi:hypothetical protein